jgi:single-stranded-DNA-specific exonuclease
MQKRWLLQPLPAHNPAFNSDCLVSKLLMQRGIQHQEEAQAFYNPDLNGLHDPFLMKDLSSAVDRVSRAMEMGEKILLFGDYDVDGTTAVALMYTILKKHYADVDYYIPDRYTEGYGVSFIGIDYAAENNFSLIISLDCGIRSVDHVAYAKEKGVDFIVCDHHQPGDELPNCLVLDPKRSDCAYPYKELSGCGVGFKLLQGLTIRNEWSMSELFVNLDLLAISIGADIVAITGENRILCAHGLKQLNTTPRRAFRELLAVAKKEFPLTLTDVVFIIAPRINAAGRLRSGRIAVELMISENTAAIQTLAQEIDQDNKNRRALDKSITEEAIEMMEKDPNYDHKKSTVVFRPDWHKGVVGIVASRLIEKRFRPTIVLTESNGKATGSARTVNDFDLYGALCECADHLEQFGGHRHAAGMTMSLENVEPFIEQFEAVVQRSISQEDEFPTVKIDLEVEFNQIFKNDENRTKVPQFKRDLARFEPHGPGNMTPVFMARNVYSRDFRILKDAHLKLLVTQPQYNIAIDAIAFNMADKEDLITHGMPYDIAFTLEINAWNGKETLQLNIKDIRAAENS